MISRIYNIDPCSAPRMTQSDKWKKRPCVVKYFAYRDELKRLGVEIPENSLIRFWIPMPPSWSKKKKEDHVSKPHRAKPDIDNLIKGVLDGIYEEDKTVWKISAEKVWGYEGAIEIQMGQCSSADEARD